MSASGAAVVLDTVAGDATGLAIPTHPAALRVAGPHFLTTAFRRFGSLGDDNEVVEIVQAQDCPGGSTGRKLFLTLRYKHPAPGLHEALFVKFSRDFEDRRRDRQRYEMASEARFAALCRATPLPLPAPAAYFADFHQESGSGLLITERIFFGQDGVEPHRLKCLDHLTLDDPLSHYRVVVAALARLAGAHKSGRLAADIDARFPFDPATGSADPIRYTEAQLEAELDRCGRFAADYPHLLPEALRTDAFLAKLREDAFAIWRRDEAIKAHLISDPDLIALCHWNAHIDNCWFWRDAAGMLQCGLLDWGRVGQITLGAALWGALSAAHHEVWDHHLDELLELFAAEYAESGGPTISAAALKDHLLLHMGNMAVARVLLMPEVVTFRLPQAADASGPFDPMFETSEPARNCLHIYTVMLKTWARTDFGRLLDALPT